MNEGQKAQLKTKLVKAKLEMAAAASMFAGSPPVVMAPTAMGPAPVDLNQLNVMHRAGVERITASIENLTEVLESIIADLK